MEIAYFLGCIMNNRYPGIEKATRQLFDALDIELKDMEGASCCPAPGVFGSFDEKTWASIAARNLSIAEDMGMDIMTECNGCFGSLTECNHMLKESEDKKAEINEVLSEVGKEFKGTTEEQAEDPSILDDLVEITGAKSVPYEDKMMCCGAGGGLRSRDLDVTLSYTKEKLEHMTEAGVDAIVNVCPFCHLQFDQGQTEVNDKYGTDYALPVFHLAQLYGLAMGLTADDLTLDAQAIDAAPALAKALGENAK